MTKRARFESAVWAIVIVASAALIGAAGLNSAALAQQARTAGIVTFSDLFTGPDSIDLKNDAAQRLADAARRAQAPGACPLGEFTIFTTAEGDPIWQKAIAAERRDVVLLALDRQGIDVSRFFVDSKVFGGKSRNDAQLDYDAGRDQTPPKLDVTWTPPKGTKVGIGTRITAKAIARDDANRWQSGIKRIDLGVEGGGSFGLEDYPQPQPPCERTPPPQTLEGVHTVRANPPPLVRLHAIAKDYAGNETEIWAEFPTGDWYGTITKMAKGGGHNHTIDIEFAFEIERSGMIKGRARPDQDRAGRDASWLHDIVDLFAERV